MTSQSKGTPPAVAALIRQRLKDQGLQVKDLATTLGYVHEDGRPTSYVYNLLSGTQPLSRRQLTLMVDALGLNGAEGDDAYFAEGMIPPDIEERLKADRLFLQSVRDLNTTDDR